MKITSRFDADKVIYESEKTTIREAVVEAVLSDANLRGANLSDADLRGAEFMGVRYYGKGGITKINKTQIEALHAALGIVVEE